MFKKIALFKNSVKVRREIWHFERELKKLKDEVSRNEPYIASDMKEIIKFFENEIFKLRACIQEAAN